MSINTESYEQSFGNIALETGKITVATGGGVIAGVSGAVAAYFTAGMAGLGIQALAGGASMLGPATLGGAVIYNIVGICIVPVAIIGGIAVGISVGVDAGKSIYKSLS